MAFGYWVLGSVSREGGLSWQSAVAGWLVVVFGSWRLGRTDGGERWLAETNRTRYGLLLWTVVAWGGATCWATHAELRAMSHVIAPCSY